MNDIKKNPVTSLGYNFIQQDSLPKGSNEYYLRNRQNNNGIKYRGLSAYEIEVLVRNRNTSDNWNNILVSDAFNPEQVHNCKFYGLVRIGKLEPYCLEFKNLRRPVGLYNSTIISCDFGDNVVIDNVDYISHYILGNEVIIVNVNELATTDYAKFGNGVVKDGEQEQGRIWLEVCNENGGRKVIPFDGMLPGDAYLWTRHRDDEALQNKFREFTLKRFDTSRGYYGSVGDRTVIKNCKIIKDVNIGSDAYLKGANKLKNLTINSSAGASSQIGEGCEIVNGIIDYGCKIFYGVKAVRFYMASHSQLKYGARLINSYLGNNSTISCCEVLNSLIFPFHEQHHNNSFLCAAMLGGQTNIAAGATIGSNHNSRSPDGEMTAGRGFWPGLCVSLKHNSRFASFTIIAKGDFPAELNIPIPFSLVSNDVANNTLVIIPGYWFMYNMYALARNSWKYTDRDKRTDKKQVLETEFLAPDTIDEMIDALDLLDNVAGFRFENSDRKVAVLKAEQCQHLFRELINYHAATELIRFIDANKIRTFDDLMDSLPNKMKLEKWHNTGGQLIKSSELQLLNKNIKAGKVKSWEDVHAFYSKQAAKYPFEKLTHALAAARKVNKFKLDRAGLVLLIKASVATKQWMTENIFSSREKDYSNPFRMMVYDSPAEMEEVVGALDANPFIQQERQAFEAYKKVATRIIRTFSV